MAARVMRHGIGTLHEHETTVLQMGNQSFCHKGCHQLIGIMHTTTSVKTQRMGQGLGNFTRLGGTHGRAGKEILRHQNSPCTNQAPSPDQP